MICSYSEVHDDVEATTNEIKKAANNARNKLKSQTASAFPYILFNLWQNTKSVRMGKKCSMLKRR